MFHILLTILIYIMGIIWSIFYLKSWPEDIHTPIFFKLLSFLEGILLIALLPLGLFFPEISWIADSIKILYVVCGISIGLCLGFMKLRDVRNRNIKNKAV